MPLLRNARVLINGEPLPVRSFLFTPSEGKPISCTFDGTIGSCLLCDEHLPNPDLKPIYFSFEMKMENVSRRLMQLMIGRTLPCPEMKKWRSRKRGW